ncbi:hypothetical protein ABH926_003575 [Catenulispora sp. GP43]|uniref:hypothetical protein n=1 Tax=Catenulispora sp. GP43 TaxID=3156263 RepID=UPI0035145FC5
MSSSSDPAGDRTSEVLQRRYDRLLTVLPKAYRAERGEELLAVLMDKSGPRQQWPTIGEVFSLAGLGIRVRFGAEHRPASAAGRAEVVRIVALLSVLLMAVQGIVEAALMARFILYESGSVPPVFRMGTARECSALAQAGWPVAFVALIAGWRRTGIALVAALAAGAILTRDSSAMGMSPYARLYGAIPYVVTAGAVVLSFRRGAAPVRDPRRWLAALIPTAAFGVASLADVLPPIVHRAAPVTGSEVTYAILLASALAVCVQAWSSPVWPVAAATGVLGCLAPELVEEMTDPFFSIGSFAAVAAAMSVGFLVLAVLSAGKQRMALRDLPSQRG